MLAGLMVQNSAEGFGFRAQGTWGLAFLVVVGLRAVRVAGVLWGRMK